MWKLVVQKKGGEVEKSTPVMGQYSQTQFVEEIDGSVQAVKIWSRVLQDEIWLILARSFVPEDELACYYPEELPLLKGKTQDQLRKIHKIKLVFPGSRVIPREEPEPRKEGY